MHSTRPDQRHQGYPPQRRQPLGIKPPKPKAWSHQDELKALIGKRITVWHAGEESHENVELLAADQFTIKVRGTVNTRLGEGPKETDFVIFKSAIQSFREA